MAASRHQPRGRVRRSCDKTAIWGLVVLVSGAAGCSSPSREPVKVEREDPAKAAKADRNRPFKNPKRDPPGPRQAAQLSGEALEANLAEARRLLEAGDDIRAMHLLYRCANRNPPSVRCDGELGMLLLENRSRKAHADYFVDEAVRLDEPEADREFYRRLADVAKRRGRFDVALSAVQRIIDRGDAEAKDYAMLSHVLQSDATRLEEAIAALEKAYELAPDEHAWLHERALLVSQTADIQTAIELFERYKEAVADDPQARAAAEQALTELRIRQDASK